MSTLDDAALVALLDLAFEFLCTRRLAELVDPARVVDALEQGATRERVARVHARVTVPLRARLLERARLRAGVLGDWLPADAAEKLAELLGAPVHVPRAWVDDVVASDRVRGEVRALLQDTLASFVSKALGGAGGAAAAGGGGGLRGALGRSVLAVGSAGLGVLGGIGGELQKQLQDKVRDYVDGSMAALQARIAEKLASEQTARDLGKRRRAGFRALLKTPEARAAKTVAALPHAALDELVPEIVAHNAAREEVRAMLRDEVRAVVEELSRESVGELLDELGLRDAARDALRAQGLPLAREFAATEGFAAWWAGAAGR